MAEPRAFAYQWSQATWKGRIANYSGNLLPYCASEQFQGTRIRPGDRLFVLGFSDAREHLLLIGRFEVASRNEYLPAEESDGALFERSEVMDLLGAVVHGVPLYGTDQDRYVLPRDGTATPMSFERVIPEPDRLRFETPQGPRYLRYDTSGRIDRQAVRRLSRVARPSGESLEALLG